MRPRLAAAQARRRVVGRAALLDGMIGVGDVPAAEDRLPLSRRPVIVDTLLTLILHRTGRVLGPSARSR